MDRDSRRHPSSSPSSRPRPTTRWRPCATSRGIYPSLLADRGLSAAIEAQVRKTDLPVSLEPDGVGRYTPEVEATVYFCVLEALQNVSKYATRPR